MLINFRLFIAFILTIYFSTNQSFAHSGGTNADGCHAGTEPYHCHTPKSGSGGSIIISAAVIGGLGLWYFLIDEDPEQVSLKKHSYMTHFVNKLENGNYVALPFINKRMNFQLGTLTTTQQLNFTGQYKQEINPFIGVGYKIKENAKLNFRLNQIKSTLSLNFTF